MSSYTAVLEGIGQRAKCERIARKLDEDSRIAYSDAQIVNAPADLPKGEYLAIFEGLHTPSRRDRGLWLTAGPIERGSAPEDFP